MRIYTNAGFCQPLSPRVAANCASISSGIRTGLAVNDNHDMVARLSDDVLSYFNEAVFIIGGWDWRSPDGSVFQKKGENLEPLTDHLANQCESLISEWLHGGGDDSNLWLEIGNELDGSYWKNHLDAYHRVAMACYKRVRRISDSVKFITGSTMNFNKEPLWKRGGYEVMNDLCRFAWPDDTVQGLHPYRIGRIWPSFASDGQALDELRRVLRGRRVAITEMGWRSDVFPDPAVADMAQREIPMWRDFGAQCFVYYQASDAAYPNNTGEGAFGAFADEIDGGEAKPVAYAIRSEKEKGI